MSSSNELKVFETKCEDELNVLNEIFPGDVFDLRKSKYSAWGAYLPPKLSIKLRPQESRAYSKPGSKQDAYSVKLVIELNTNYPKEKPQSLKVTGDLPEANKSKLNEILNTLSEEKSKQGEVYLYDLCVFTQEQGILSHYSVDITLSSLSIFYE